MTPSCIKYSLGTFQAACIPVNLRVDVTFLQASQLSRQQEGIVEFAGARRVIQITFDVSNIGNFAYEAGCEVVRQVGLPHVIFTVAVFTPRNKVTSSNGKEDTGLSTMSIPRLVIRLKVAAKVMWAYLVVSVLGILPIVYSMVSLKSSDICNIDRFRAYQNIKSIHWVTSSLLRMLHPALRAHSEQAFIVLVGLAQSVKPYLPHPSPDRYHACSMYGLCTCSTSLSCSRKLCPNTVNRETVT